MSTSFLGSLLWFVVTIGILVTVHEFGHFWVARRLGVKVLRFSVGFGRALARWRSPRDGTEYQLSAIPLGGYVKMLDEREGAVAPEDLPRAFNRQSVGVRIAVVAAGPAFNFVFAILAYWLMFVIGIAGARPLVGEVDAGSRAAHAGLGPDQEIVAVDGRATPTWQAVIERIIDGSLEGGAVEVVVRGADGLRHRHRLDLEGLALDDLTEGQLFDTLGLHPERPRVVPVLGEIQPGSPAERAGLRPGDRVLRVDGRPVEEWSAFVEAVRAAAGRPLRLTLERGGALEERVVRPEPVTDGEGRTIGRIGAGVRPPQVDFDRYRVVVRHDPATALGKAVVKTGDMTSLVLRMMWKMVALEVSVRNLSGPISIAQYAGMSARVGVARFLDFLAVVSISLGVLNLLPVPLLDGGHLMYYFMELLRGKPVSEEAQFIGQRLGIALLIGLMGLAFYNDIARLLG